MKNIVTIKGILYTVFILFTSYQTQAQNDIIAANAKPMVFLQEGVAVPNGEMTPTFTPNGKTVFLADSQIIKMSQLVKGKWTKPVPITISGKWKDWDPTLSPDGKQLVFVSNRPLEDLPQDKPQRGSHLWTATWLGKQAWSAPRHIEETGASAYAPCLSKAGSLCFCSRGREGDKKMYGYYTKWLGDHYDKPQLLKLIADKEVYDPYISPDERYIIFAADDKLYISHRDGDGWSTGQKLGPVVNAGDNGDPVVSPDGKMLYYTSSLTKGILMIQVNISRKH